jgi:hypothetical protein
MEKDKAEIQNLEDQMTELMKGHLDEVAGGAAHSSWKRSSVVEDESELA